MRDWQLTATHITLASACTGRGREREEKGTGGVISLWLLTWTAVTFSEIGFSSSDNTVCNININNKYQWLEITCKCMDIPRDYWCYNVRKIVRKVVMDNGNRECVTDGVFDMTSWNSFKKTSRKITHFFALTHTMLKSKQMGALWEFTLHWSSCITLWDHVGRQTMVWVWLANTSVHPTRVQNPAWESGGSCKNPRVKC